MGSANQIYVMTLVKFSDNVRPEYVTHSSVIVTPSLDVNLGIRPKQIAQQSCVRNVLRSVLLVDHLQVIKIGTQSSVHNENFVIHHCANREDIEAEAKLFPYLDVVSSLALVVESVHSVDRLALVISSKQVEVLWVFYFVGEQQTNCLNGLFAAINIVSDEEEFLVAAWKSSYVEETEQIEVLAVHISENFDWCLQV